jgi:hypothetical protein
VDYLEDKNFDITYNTVSRLLLVFFGAIIGSTLPKWSFTLFIVETSLIIIGFLIAFYLYKTIEDGRKFNLLTAFIAFTLMGIYFAFPLIRLSEGTIIYWMFLIAFLLMFVSTLISSISVFRAMNFPGKLLKGISISAALLFLGAFFVKNSQGLIYSQLLSLHGAVAVFSIFFYVGGLIIVAAAFASAKEFF